MARGGLARLIRLVEHRSARILEIGVHGDSAAGVAVVELRIEGRLRAAMLARQIEKLYDVTAVEVDDAGDPAAGDFRTSEGKNGFRC